MDTNPNPYQFPNQPGQSNVPPPPPSPEAQVGVRGMQSDLESIKQSGGEAPQSQIINAPELTQFGQQSAAPAPQASAPQTEPMAPGSPETGIPIPEPSPSKFNFKTILFIVGGLILAGGIGYGAYYLVSSLTATPEVTLPQPQANLPVTPPPVATTTPTSTPPAPVIQPLVHQSLIVTPTKKETIQLLDASLASFEAALATSSKEKLLVGSVKDLAFVNASSTPIESSALIQAYFASQASSIPIFGKDFTSWFYYGKTGGAKLGAILELKSTISLDQASTTVKAAIESAVSSISGLFISNPAVPAKTEFNDGKVENVPVRFLAFSTKNADVFEYGWFTRGTTNYLFMVTSYDQAVDIVKRLKALPALPVSGIQSTSTATTTGTTTGM